MAQVTEHLPSKCKALNSNPSTASKQKKKKPPFYMNKQVSQAMFVEPSVAGRVNGDQPGSLLAVQGCGMAVLSSGQWLRPRSCSSSVLVLTPLLCPG
jgi:hypothetical protein